MNRPAACHVRVGLQPSKKTVLPLGCDLKSPAQVLAVISTSLTIIISLSDVDAGDLGLSSEAEQCVNGKSLKRSCCCSIPGVTVILLSLISHPLVVP